MERVDVIVVCAGVMGSAAARWLARDREVVILEQFEVGHARGSSHGRSRIFRFSYPDPKYVQMARRALGLWREVEAESDRTLLRTTGGFDLGPGIEANAAALDACGATYEMLPAAEVTAGWTRIRVPPDAPVLYQPDAGFVLADRAVRTFIDLALARGAKLRQHTRVDRLEIRSWGVRAVCGNEVFEAPVAVVAAGGWARELLAGAGIELPTRSTRETVAYFGHPAEILPTVVEWQSPAIYALPSPGQGVKVGEHIAGAETDPDEIGRPDLASVERISEWVAARFPGADPRPHLIETCIYTNTADESFILERHGSIVVGSPCSGHGFKFAPLIGKMLADLATDA